MNAREHEVESIMNLVQDLCFAVHKEAVGLPHRNIEDIRLDVECRLKKLADPGYLAEDVRLMEIIDVVRFGSKSSDERRD